MARQAVRLDDRGHVRVADALGCDLVYALVPRSGSLEADVRTAAACIVPRELILVNVGGAPPTGMLVDAAYPDGRDASGLAALLDDAEATQDG